MTIFERLEPHLESNRPCLVALSGGADSSVLLAALVSAGRTPRVAAATFTGPLHHPDETARAGSPAERLGVDHYILPEDPPTDEDFTANGPDRCYHCKKRRLAALSDLAYREGFGKVLDGTNFSLIRTRRPGLRAAAETGLTKAEVLELRREGGLFEWLRPPSACLTARIEYGRRLTRELIEKVWRAEEEVAAAAGAEPGSFRVRVHDRLARMELPPGARPALTTGPEPGGLVQRLRGLGFLHVTIDLEGLRSGSMGRGLANG